MNRQRLAVLVALVGIGGAVALFRVVAPDRYEVAVSEGQQLVSGLPDPVVVAAVWLVVVLIWIAAMVLAARVLYWAWRQIDDYVFRLWDLLLPQSPIVRFGIGITLMIAFFVLGPLVVIQAMEITSEDPINDTRSGETLPNDTTTDDGPSNETATDDGPSNDTTTDEGPSNDTTTSETVVDETATNEADSQPIIRSPTG